LIQGTLSIARCKWLWAIAALYSNEPYLSSGTYVFRLEIRRKKDAFYNSKIQNELFLTSLCYLELHDILLFSISEVLLFTKPFDDIYSFTISKKLLTQD